MRCRKAKGFSIIELMITLVVLGIISTMALPALLNALDKGRQRRTMADIRLMGGSIEAYAVDVSTYPVGTGVGALAVLRPDYYG